MAGQEHLARAQLLLEQNRAVQAEKEVRAFLAEEPNHAQGLLLLAHCMLQQDRLNDARVIVDQAIGADPNNDHGFHIRAAIHYNNENYLEALTDIQQAIQMDPYDASHFGLKANILLARKEYDAALRVVEEGLAVDPDNVNCLNVRTQLLVKLGRKTEADEAADRVLEQDPDNAFTHANVGWAALERGDHKTALKHFQEALRLDPNNPFARSGMAEALKAKFLLYRLWLRYAFWISNLKQGAQWGIIIGLWLAVRLINSVGASNPSLLPIVYVVVGAYIIFAFTSWAMSPLTDLFLRLSQYGRYLLTKDEILVSNITGGLLAVAAVGGIGWALVGSTAWLYTAFFGLTMIIPVAGSTNRGLKPMSWLVYYTGGLFIVGLLALGVLFATGQDSVLTSVYLLGWVAFTWIANVAR